MLVLYDTRYKLDREFIANHIATLKCKPVLPDDNRVLEPPDPIPNSEVKRYIADGSVGLPHVRVGHRQAFIPKAHSERSGPFLLC